jgi:hypothetical protein
MRNLCFLIITTILCGCINPVFGQIYSYIGENGVRVFTNIPPSNPVRDLRVTGAAPPAAAPEATAPKARRTSVSTKPASARTAGNRQSAVQQPNKGGTLTAAPVGAAGAETGENPADYAAIIEKYSGEYGVDPKLIHSMIATESAFNSNAVSPKGAQGLMQLMPGTASRLGVSDPFDPVENISGGIRYMRSLLDMFSGYPDPLIMSLAAYNAGENLVQRLGRVPAIRETNDYVRNIMQRYGQKETVVQNPIPEQNQTPMQFPTFRYVDEKGILVLTNIPPVSWSGNINIMGGSRAGFR